MTHYQYIYIYALIIYLITVTNSIKIYNSFQEFINSSSQIHCHSTYRLVDHSPIIYYILTMLYSISMILLTFMLLKFLKILKIGKSLKLLFLLSL